MVRGKRIVYVMQEYPVSTQTFVENEALALEELGFRVTRYPLHSTGRRPGADVVVLQDILLRPSRWGALVASLGSVFRSWRLIWSIVRAERLGANDLSRQFFALLHAVILDTYVRSEIDQVQFMHAHFLGRCTDVIVFCKILASGRPLRFSATGHAGDVTNPGTPSRLQQQVQFIDGIVCASRTVGDALERLSGRPPNAIVHCGIRPVTSLRPNGGERLPLRILSVGRLVEKKGFQDAIQAARQLASAGFCFEWRFVGSGPLKGELLELSQKLVKSGNIVWVGALPSQDVLDLLTEWADMFVLPCRKAANGDADGIPVALMEAMTSGIPVVSSRVAGIPELITSAETGYLIEPGNVQQLVDYMSLLFDSRSERRRIAAAGKTFVDQNFNLQLEAEKIAAVLFSPAN